MKLVDTRDLKSLASNSVPVQVRLRVPLHSPILSYRTAKAPDIRGFVVSGVLEFVTVFILDSTKITYRRIKCYNLNTVEPRLENPNQIA